MELIIKGQESRGKIGDWLESLSIFLGASQFL
jgi:hypothetical protein